MANYDNDLTLTVGMKLGDVKAASDKLVAEIEKIYKASSGKRLSGGFTSLQIKLGALAQKATVVTKRMQELETTKVPTSEFVRLESELNKIEAKYAKVNEKRRELEKQGKINTAEYERVGMELQKLVNQADQVRDKMSDMQAAGTHVQSGAETAEYKKWNEELARIVNKMGVYLNQLRATHELPVISNNSITSIANFSDLMAKVSALLINFGTNAKVTGRQLADMWKNTPTGTEYVKSALTSVSAKLKQVQDSFTRLKYKAQYEFLGVEAAILRIPDVLANMKARMASFDLKGALAGGIQGFTTALNNSVNVFRQGFTNALSNIPNIFNRAVGFVITGIDKLATSFATVIRSGFPGFLRLVGSGLLAAGRAAGTAAINLVKFAAPKIIEGIKAIAKHAIIAAKSLANMAKNAAKAAGRGIINGFKRLASAIGKTNKASSNANGTFKKGFLFLLRYALGIRSIYFLFKRLRKALGEGIGNLAQYSPNFNKTISDFISALTRLKNSFAAAFAPVINVVLPIITAFIDAMSDAMTKVGMFFAALTGQKTYIAAKKVHEDYAASLDKTKDSTDKAKKSAEAYQRTISGFDDVEILKEPNNGSSSGDGNPNGGTDDGSISPADMFETGVLPAGYYDLAQMIKNAWANADFTEVGELLGKKLAEALNKIPWTKIQALADKFGKSFATFLNGLLSVTELAKQIGKTIGETINTIFILANGFVTNLKWEQIGKFLADVMNEGVKTIKWELIASTLATAANGIFNAIGTWATEFDFTALGTSIRTTVENTLKGLKWGTITDAVSSVGTGLAKFVNSLITPDSFGEVGKFIARALNTAIEGIESFAIEFDGKNLGKSIGSGINNFFSTFNFKKAGITFGTVADKVFTALATAIQEIRWKDIGKDLQDFVLSIPWGKLIGDVATIAGSAVGALASLVAGLFSGLPKAIKDYFDEKTNQQGGNIVAGIFTGVADFFINIVKWIKENILDKFVDGFKKAFDISSPAKEKSVVELGKYVIEGVFNGVINWVDGIKTWIKDHILKPFTDAWNKLGGLTGIIDTAVDIVVSVSKKFGGWVEDAWTAIKTGGQNFTSTVQVALQKANIWVQDAWTAFTETGEVFIKRTVQLLQSSKNWVANAWDVFKNTKDDFIKRTIQVVQSSKNWNKDAWNVFKNTADDFIKRTIQTVKSSKNWNKDAWSIFKNTADDFIKRTVQLVKSSKNWTQDAWNVFKNTGEKFVKRTMQVVKSGINWNKDAWSVFKNTGEKFVKRTMQIVKSSKNWSKDAWNAFSNTQDEFIKRTIQVSLSIVSGAKDKILEWLGLQKEGGVYTVGIGWKNIAQYASGGMPSHGTMFVAGEAGAETVGHIHGRTEVLNQSQMAAVMYSSVIAGVAPVINYMKECTNAIITNISSELNYLKFMSGQLYSINTLSNTLSTNVGNIVTGKVVPNNFNSNDMNNLNQTLDKLSSMLYDTRSKAVTREELTSILTTMFTRYMNFSCYIGDEDIARHANNGNARLEMRFSPVAR